jgi:hypothetical protein
MLNFRKVASILRQHSCASKIFKNRTSLHTTYAAHRHASAAASSAGEHCRCVARQSSMTTLSSVAKMQAIRGVRLNHSDSKSPKNDYGQSVTSKLLNSLPRARRLKTTDNSDVLYDEETVESRCLCVCVSVCLCACVPVCLCACVPVCLCACVPVCLCVCVSVSILKCLASACTMSSFLHRGRITSN